MWSNVISGYENKEDIPPFSKSFALCNGIFLSVGLAIRDTKRHWATKYLLKAIYILMMAIIYSCIVGELIYFLKALDNYTNFLKVTEVAPCVGFCILGVCKIATVQLQKQKVDKIINTLESMYLNIDERFKDIVIKAVKVMIRKSYMFTILMLFLIWIFNVCALCTTAYYYFFKDQVILLLPYLVWTPFDSFRPDIYPFMYLYHVASGYVAMNTLLSADLLFAFLTGHLCMHFDLLAQRICRIGQGQNKGMYKELVECIQQHKVLIGISEDLENIFSFSIFMNFSGSSILICLVGFQTTAVTGIALFMFLIFLISMVVQIYQLCDAGHDLIEKSESLSKAIYECNWNDCDRKFKRTAQILMARAQKSQKLTALRFSVVSLTSFGKVMSTSWSYFTLLQTVYQGPKNY